MTLIEQIIGILSKHFVNPLFEPIIIDKQVLTLFSKKELATKKSNLKKMKYIKKALEQFPDDSFSTSILKTNLIQFIDVLIEFQQQNEDKIANLKTENFYLEKYCNRLKRKNRVLKLRPVMSHLIFDSSLSKEFRDAMSFNFTLD
jgi:hypothetical protein